eukprot:g18944.t1
MDPPQQDITNLRHQKLGAQRAVRALRAQIRIEANRVAAENRCTQRAERARSQREAAQEQARPDAVAPPPRPKAKAQPKADAGGVLLQHQVQHQPPVVTAAPDPTAVVTPAPGPTPGPTPVVTPDPNAAALLQLFSNQSSSSTAPPVLQPNVGALLQLFANQSASSTSPPVLQLQQQLLGGLPALQPTALQLLTASLQTNPGGALNIAIPNNVLQNGSGGALNVLQNGSGGASLKRSGSTRGPPSKRPCAAAQPLELYDDDLWNCGLGVEDVCSDEEDLAVLSQIDVAREEKKTSKGSTLGAKTGAGARLSDQVLVDESGDLVHVDFQSGEELFGHCTPYGADTEDSLEKLFAEDAQPPAQEDDLLDQEDDLLAEEN